MRLGFGDGLLLLLLILPVCVSNKQNLTTSAFWIYGACLPNYF